MTGFLRHIAACNTHDPARYRPFRVAGQVVGCVRADLVDTLPALGDVFEPVSAESVDGSGGGIALAPRFTTPDQRSRALAFALDRLLAAGVLKKLRREAYPVLTRWGAEPLATIDRGAVPLFGLKSFGLHVNGYVRRADGLHLWVGKRAMDRGIAPGQYDNLVAGGQPAGLTLAENLVKEAAEEAGLDAATALTARPVGHIAYRMDNHIGLKDDTLFCFDLELGEGVVPRNTDGEVERFELWPVARVLESVRDTDDWKFNVNLVVIDFLIRHGIIGPDHPEYLALGQGLRR
jgi:8-oxo-dGTP pyrophosphatase MutT (NUDIX family)